MLHVILTILIVLGIIIAVILGIIILILAAVLFVPVRYRIKAQYYDKPEADIRIHWLFHIVNVCVQYNPEDFLVRFRILWFRLYDNHREKKPKRKRKKQKKNNTNRSEFEKESFELPKTSEQRFEDEKKETARTIQPNSETDNPKDFNRDCAIDDRENVTPHRRNVFKRIKLFFIKIKNIFLDLCDKIKTVWNRLMSFLRSWRENLTKWNDMIQDEKNREFINLLKSELKKLMRHIRPTKYRVYAKFGSDDPETVGQVTALVAMFCGFTGMNISYVPVFEQNVFEGEIFLKGRIRLFRLALLAFHLYRNEVFRKLIGKI